MFLGQEANSEMLCQNQDKQKALAGMLNELNKNRQGRDVLNEIISRLSGSKSKAMNSLWQAILNFWATEPEIFRPFSSSKQHDSVACRYVCYAANIPFFHRLLSDLWKSQTRNSCFVLFLPDREVSAPDRIELRELCHPLVLRPFEREEIDEQMLVPLASYAMQCLRGEREFGDNMPAVFKISKPELEGYFHKPRHFRVFMSPQMDKTIEADKLVAQVPYPDNKDRKLVDLIIRVYWFKLLNAGFETVEKIQADPFRGKLPVTLRKNGSVVDFRSVIRLWGAMYRLYFVNLVLKAHMKGKQS